MHFLFTQCFSHDQHWLIMDGFSQIHLGITHNVKQTWNLQPQNETRLGPVWPQERWIWTCAVPRSDLRLVFKSKGSGGSVTSKQYCALVMVDLVVVNKCNGSFNFTLTEEPCWILLLCVQTLVCALLHLHSRTVSALPSGVSFSAGQACHQLHTLQHCCQNSTSIYEQLLRVTLSWVWSHKTWTWLTPQSLARYHKLSIEKGDRNLM